MTSLQTTVKQLGISEFEDVLGEDWGIIQSSRSAGETEFLQPDYLRWACGVAYLPSDMTEAVVAAGRSVARSGPLSALAAYCSARLFPEPDRQPDVLRWPYLSHAMKEEAGLFYVLVLLSGTGRMQQIHRDRGIPDRVVRDSGPILAYYMQRPDSPVKGGHWGVTPENLLWLLYWWRGWSYRIGRLMFVPSCLRGRFFPKGLFVFRHRESGRVVALSEDGIRYRADGQVDGASGAHDPGAGWTSALKRSDAGVAGNPISPRGHALPEPVSLPAKDWMQVLGPGDPTLEIHIPHGSPLDHAACGESIRRALEFFPRHFPDRPFSALTCFSWFTSGQFEQLLSKSSNVVRFNQEMYLFPRKAAASSTESVLWHVSGDHYDYPIEREGKTSMQLAFEQHAANGGHFTPGGCFLLPEDFAWGSRVYRGNKAL